MRFFASVFMHFHARIATALLVCACSARAEVASPKSATGLRFEDRGAEVRLAEIMELAIGHDVPNVVGRSQWVDQLGAYKPEILSCRSHAEFAEAVNDCFRAMGVSHFRYYTDEEWSYWYTLSAFSRDDESKTVTHIGIVPQDIEGRWFVRGVLEGSPAANGDFRVGDEIVALNDAPFEPIRGLRGKAGQPVIVKLRRRPQLLLNVRVVPVRESLFRAVYRAQQSSLRVLDHGGHRMAYFQMWSLLGGTEDFEPLLNLQDEVDGLILDFRDGFGGNPFAAQQFLLGPTGRLSSDPRTTWFKPVVILIADGTRSAKEMVVDAVKNAGRAPLVGVPTPGDVTTVGALQCVGSDGLLMLPGAKLELEGKPTRPDFLVPRELRYCAGADPQLDAAKIVLTERISKVQSPVAPRPPATRNSNSSDR